MSASDPQSRKDLLKLARRARDGKTLSRNEEWELSRAKSQVGSLSRDLDRIMRGG